MRHSIQQNSLREQQGYVTGMEKLRSSVRAFVRARLCVFVCAYVWTQNKKTHTHTHIVFTQMEITEVVISLMRSERERERERERDL